MTVHAYDRIGSDYHRTRGEDPRIARHIIRVLGEAATVANIGAGTGSYEPADRTVVAVEPSTTMIRQRAQYAAPVVRALAESLPFRDRAFTASLAILTVHHWNDRSAGLSELCRIAAERVVILTWDPESDGFWLVQDYFPEFIEADRKRLPSMIEFSKFFHSMEVIPVPIPHDCCDGFLGAYWRRPDAYLRPEVRSGISCFATCFDLRALERLAKDLKTGRWEELYGDLLKRDELDIGYRLITGSPRHFARYIQTEAPL